jgi:hypothetical protein
MTIDTGKILKTSDKDYFNITEENKSDYVLLKVISHIYKPLVVKERFQEVHAPKHLSLKSNFARRVPEGTEVVVNYKEKKNTPYFISATGTALVPKPKKPEKSKLEITLDKIFTIIPPKAKRNMKKDPDYYRKEEIHFLGHIEYPEFDSVLREFAKNVPDEAEFVINYGETKDPAGTYGIQGFAIGTALIPKAGKLEEKK